MISIVCTVYYHHFFFFFTLSFEDTLASRIEQVLSPWGETICGERGRCNVSVTLQPKG